MPALKHLKVAEATFSDVDGLHRRITKRGRPYSDRVIALLSKMFNLAIRWGWRTHNPARGIEKNREQPRHRYLSADELLRLTAALAEYADQQAANIIRLLLLTGARRGEVQAAKWEDIDLEQGIWTKPGATTEQKTLHRVPLSAPARQLSFLSCVSMPRRVNTIVFPSRNGGHRVELKYDRAVLCKARQVSLTRVCTICGTLMHRSQQARGSPSRSLVPCLAIHSRKLRTGMRIS